MIVEDIDPDDLYHHIDRSIAMRFYLNCKDCIIIYSKDVQDEFDDLCIINIDLHCRQYNGTMYCIATREQDASKNIKWVMKDEFYTEKQINKKFGISSHALPKSNRDVINQQFKQ